MGVSGQELASCKKLTMIGYEFWCSDTTLTESGANILRKSGHGGFRAMVDGGRY